MKNFCIFCTGLMLLATGTFVIAGQMPTAQTTRTNDTQKRDKF